MAARTASPTLSLRTVARPGVGGALRDAPKPAPTPAPAPGVAAAGASCAGEPTTPAVAVNRRDAATVAKGGGNAPLPPSGGATAPSGVTM
jgi:hypothetical protein